MPKIYLAALFLFLNSLYAQELVVRFSNDSYTILKEDVERLNALVSMEIESLSLEGFTDQNGSESYNQTLSANRVRTIRDSLISFGLDENKILSAVGRGKYPDLSKTFDEQRCVVVSYTLTIRNVKTPVLEIVEESEPIVERPRAEPSLTEKIIELEVGQKLALHNLTFVPGRRYLMPEAQEHFNELLNILEDNPTLKIEIHGHVCCTPKSQRDGPDLDTGKSNLSEMRARQVYDLLVEAGISKKRLSYRSFGGRKPMVAEVDDQSRQMNRRVEIMIVEK